jgi:hypothetical protein
MAATQPIANMVNCLVVVDRNGKLIEAWNQWDKLFEWGRGPHQVYISPYDPERYVWVVDDMRHVIYRFTTTGSSSCRRSACSTSSARTTTSRASVVPP